MIDLRKYDLESKWPKLTALMREVSDLERRRTEVEGQVMAARNAIPAARDKDAEAASVAIRSGKAMPQPKHEAEALAALEGAERTLTALAKAVQSAQADLNNYLGQHREAIHAALVEAARKSDERLAQHAREAARLYAFREDAQYDLKALAPPPAPPDENAPAQRLSTTVIGIKTMKSAAPNRGDVEQLLGYLATLEAPHTEPDGGEVGAA